MATKPSLPKGTRDFSPDEVAKRNYIMRIIRKQFELYGFQPIETPTFENTETLMGKYGEEGDRLIFKILNSGSYLEKISEDELLQKNYKAITPKLSEKALRYDLTVPFARFVVMHQNKLEFPFKRYQIQPVWRADRPQKGRFREFYQCDADVVGSNSLWQEVEFIQLYDSVFTHLGLKGVTIKVNNRKILSGFADLIGAGDKLIDFTVSLDKIDKLGIDSVIEEMISKGISAEAIAKLQPIFLFKGNLGEKIHLLYSLFKDSEDGKRGLSELQFICERVEQLGLNSAQLEIDVTLARGLNYYTGSIFEVVAQDVSMGSIGGGGRYDDLTGIFGMKNLSGVGISFGLDRIYLVLEALGLFPETVAAQPKVLFANYGPEEAMCAMDAIKELRDLGVSAELYPDHSKIAKQFQYAEKKGIFLVVLLGTEELKQERYMLKDLRTGKQELLSKEHLFQKLNS